MPTWASTLLGVGVGALLTYVGVIRVEARRRREDETGERRRALAEYLGRLYIVVGTVTQWPQELPPSIVDRLRRATWERSARVRMRDWIRAQRQMRKVFGDSLYEPLHRFMEAYAVLQLLRLEDDVRRQIASTADYVERLAIDRSLETVGEWEDLRARLLEAIGAAGDAVAADAAEPVARAAEIERADPGVATTASSQSRRARLRWPVRATEPREASAFTAAVENEAGPGYVEATIGELRDAVRAMLDDEQDRGNSLNTRASGLTGFLGVILSVAAAAGAGLGGRDAGAGLESWVKVTVASCLAAALVALVTAVILVVWKVLRPQAGLAVSTDDTDRFTKKPFIMYRPVEVHGYLVDAYAQALKAERKRNDSKATWLNWTYALVCVALALVAAAGTAATLDRYVGDTGRAGSAGEQQLDEQQQQRPSGADGGAGEPVPAPTDAADQ